MHCFLQEILDCSYYLYEVILCSYLIMANYSHGSFFFFLVLKFYFISQSVLYDCNISIICFKVANISRLHLIKAIMVLP